MWTSGWEGESFPGRASKGRGSAVGMGLACLRPVNRVRGYRAEQVRTGRWKMTGRGDLGQIRSGQHKDSGLHSEMGGFPGEDSRNTSCH